MRIPFFIPVDTTRFILSVIYFNPYYSVFVLAILLSTKLVLHKTRADGINLYRFNVPEKSVIHKINALSKMSALPKINALSKIKPLRNITQIMLYIFTSKLNYNKINQCENAAQLISLIEVLFGL